MSGTYADVDAGVDPAEAVRWQDRVDSWPQIRAYKRRAQELLGTGAPVLDLGCGPGGDVVALGGRGVGVDPSMAMCRAAAARAVPVCRADGHALPFAAATFGGARTDRVLQHVVDPDVVLDELVRVVRPGSPVVVAEPDQESLVIHVPGVRRDLTDRLKALRRDVGYRNGRLASSLAAGLVARGLTDVAVEPFPLLVTDPDDAFGLPTWPVHWQAEGGFDDADLAEWDTAIERARAAASGGATSGGADGYGGFVYALTFLVVSGRAPSPT